MLQKSPDIKEALRKHLFEKGFLITDAELDASEDYPFFGNWKRYNAGSYRILAYRSVPVFLEKRGDAVFFLVGHAYDPFTMEHEESRILSAFADASKASIDWDLVDELTGIFIMGVVRGRCVSFWLDASGMQYGCYGTVNGKQYITSHMRLVGDLCGLETDPYVDRLVHYKWYHYMMGNYLPGDLSCFTELKRIIPNTAIHFDGTAYRIERFYPRHELRMCETEAEYDGADPEKVGQARHFPHRRHRQ